MLHIGSHTRLLFSDSSTFTIYSPFSIVISYMFYFIDFANCYQWFVPLLQMLLYWKIILDYFLFKVLVLTILNCRFNSLSYIYFLVHVEPGSPCDHSSVIFITFFQVLTKGLFILEKLSPLEGKIISTRSRHA